MLVSAEEDLLSFLFPCTDPHSWINKHALLSRAIRHPKNGKPAEFPDSPNRHERRVVLCTRVMLGAQAGLQLESVGFTSGPPLGEELTQIHDFAVNTVL